MRSNHSECTEDTSFVNPTTLSNFFPKTKFPRFLLDNWAKEEVSTTDVG